MAGICYVAPDIAIPSPRGASTHILELAAALAKLGDEVHIVSKRLAGQKPVEEIRNVTLHRMYRWPGGVVPASEGWGTRGNDSRSVGFESLGYRLYLQTFNAARAGFFAARIIRGFSLGAVLERETAFGAGAFASVITGRPLLLEVIGPRSSPFSLSRCFKLLAYSSLMVPNEFRSRTEYVEAGVNTEIFKADGESRRKLREKLGLGDGIVVGYVGTFQTFHGVSDLLKAVELASRRRNDLKVLLVGPYSQSAVKLAADLRISSKVIFVGPVGYEDVPSYINASDIMVAPYNTVGTDRAVHGIGSPLKVLEYMATGKPTIGSSLPQLTTILQDGITGRLFPEGDFKRLAEIILELADSPVERERLGKKGSSMVNEKYVWSTLASRINDLILEHSRHTRE